MTIGGKYKWVPDSNPAPGQYDPNDSITKPRPSTAAIRQPTSPSRRPLEHTPSPGDYTNMYLFGQEPKGAYIGEKLKYPVDQTPGPGQYEDSSAVKHTKSRVLGGRIHEEQMIMVDVNSLRGADRYTFKARAQSPGVKSSVSLSSSVYDRKSPIKPFASNLKDKTTASRTSMRKKKVGDNSRLLQSIGKLKESTFNDLDQKQRIKAVNNGSEIKRRSTYTLSQDYDVSGLSPANRKQTIKSSKYSNTTAAKTVTSTALRSSTAKQQYYA